MNPNPNLEPMEDPVAAALARRGLGQQAPQMPQGGGMPQAAPSPQMGQAPMPAQPAGAPVPAKFEPKNSTEFILTTLAEQLKNDNKLEMEKLKFNSPML
jgi:hypothetical protein